MGRRGIASAVILTLLCILPPMTARAAKLTLQSAIDLALQGTEAVRIRELALQKARLAIDQANAALLPQVNLQASASYLVNPPQGYTVKAGQLGTLPIPMGPIALPRSDFTIGSQLHDYFSLSASLSQPILTWGKIRGAIDLATLQADAAATDLAAQRREVEREVRRAYYSALLAQESAVVLEKLEGTAGEIAADRQKAVDDGTSNKEAVLQAQADLAQIQSKHVQAVQSRLTALQSLGMLTGLDPAGIELATGWIDSLPALDEKAISDAALGSSTDLAAARTRLQQSRRKLDVEKGGSLLLPDVSLGLSFDVTGQEDLPFAAITSTSGTWNWDLVISLGMKMSVFDGFSSRSRILQAEKDADAASTAAVQQEKLVRLSVRKALDAALRADADVTEKQAGSAYAEEKLKNARASWDAGMISRADLHGAEILEGTAALDLLLSQYTRQEALADVAELTGQAP
jgi:outer membrane protein